MVLGSGLWVLGPGFTAKSCGFRAGRIWESATGASIPELAVVVGVRGVKVEPHSPSLEA